MGKGANKELLKNSGVASSRSGQIANQGGQLAGFLTPQLESEANHPQGYTPQQMAYMNTASQQSLGGSVAGATGQANLESARTRNAGGNQGAIASSARSAQRQLSTNALGVQKSQADLQQAQRQQALSSLQSLYGVDEQTALNYLSTSDTGLHELNQSHPNQQGLQTAGEFAKNISQAAAAAAGA